MTSLVSRIDDRFYPGVGGNWDDTRFRQLILEYCDPGVTMLDVGAGAGIVAQMNFRGEVAKVCGIDPDPRVVENPYLDEGKVGYAEDIPFPDSTFDVVISDNVLEHLERPLEVFREVTRVLKPGGVFLVKTPNKKHYVPLIARLTPHRFHQYFNRMRGREQVDTFPTRYLANSISDVRRIAESANLAIEDIKLIESRPEYLRINPFTYLVGVCYERTVNKFEFLSGFRVLLMGILRKPAED